MQFSVLIPEVLDDAEHFTLVKADHHYRTHVSELFQTRNREYYIIPKIPLLDNALIILPDQKYDLIIGDGVKITPDKLSLEFMDDFPILVNVQYVPTP